MNICFFNWQESTGVAMEGGVQRATSLLAKELRRRGYRVVFYYSELHYRFRIPIVSGLLRSLFPSFLPSLRSNGKRFRQFIEEHKIDVAVLHETSCLTPFPLKNLPCKLITVWHLSPSQSEQTCADRIINGLKLRSRFTQQLVQSKPCRFLAWELFNFFHSHFFSYVLRCGDKIILLSESFIPEFHLSKKFPHKVCAIPNIAPFGEQNVSSDEKKKKLLFVGRMEMLHKQPHLLLQIWHKLENRFPDWSLCFVGKGECLPELKALAKELGVQRVFFEGFQDPVPYYRSAPIFCMTSAYEGFGLVLVEAQAYGCVPVAFESFSAVRDIIEDGVNGFLVPPFNLDIYAEKLAQLMSDSELREKFAHNAQKSVAKFSAEAIGDKYALLLGGGA